MNWTGWRRGGYAAGMPENVRIFDTTLRDGEQAPGFSMNPDEKLRLALELEALGVDVLEAGFPIASAGDFEGVERIARACQSVRVAALARATPGDIRRAAEALRPAARPLLHVFMATSDIHLHHKFHKTRAQVLEEVPAMVALGRSLVAEVEFSAEDATRTDPEYLIAVLDAAVAAGATTLNIPDTVGFTVPQEYAALIAHLRSRVRGADHIIFSVHCHDDLGLAVANSLAALAAGARQIECAINGIGERAGNAALEEIAVALHVRQEMFPYATNIVLEKLHATSQLLTEITGVAVQPNKAIVGRNAFAHEAGIHQDGMLKSPLTYEIMTPRTVGRGDHEMVLGKHSGRHAIQVRLAHLGYQFDTTQMQAVYERFIVLADRRKVIDDNDLHRIARDLAATPAAVS